jgi:membrane peptidoglycan carboxypeptidase
MRTGKLVKKFLITIGKPVLLVFKGIFRLFSKVGLIKIKINIRWRWLLPTVLMLIISGSIWWFYEKIMVDLPNVNEIYNPPKMSTKILDRNGNLLFKFYQDENRSWVSLDKIPQPLIWATLAIEDKDYYNHHGLSVRGMAQAVFFNIFKKGQDQNLRGGSTITQQLVKKVFFTDEKTWTRKIKEAVLSVMVEKKLSKNEILERYFNQVSYGGDTYGAEEASQKYFGKDVWEIDAAEAAYLAGLPAAPSSYSPFGNDPGLGFIRQKHVIEEMVSASFISTEKANEILAEKLKITNNEPKIEAPHFVFYVKDYLGKNFGFKDVDKRGLVVTTSLDLNLQNKAEKIVKEEVGKDKNLRISNGAALITDPKTGEILAMVGSKNYYAADIDGKYNVTTALRQPGSSIKPINYLLALIKGWTLAGTVEDEPIVYQVRGQKPYAPQNYDGKFRGLVTLRTALASSLNVPSVRILAQNGVGNMIDLAQLMGITTWGDRSRFGLALALGSGEVKMTEMATAYGTFANLGEKVEPEPILEIKNYLGETIYQAKPKKEQIVDPKLAFMIDDVLSDNNARSPIFGLNSKLKISGKTVAVKTGTTNILRDNWCIGWTPNFLVASWVGNNDDTPMSWVASGISGATPIWSRIMTDLLANKPNETWAVPNGVYKANICGRDEYFINGTEKSVVCPPPPQITPTPTN